MMTLKEVFVALGGNIGNVSLNLTEALKALKNLPEICDLRISRFYKTTPVSDLPQNPFVNAVCTFRTTFSASDLLRVLQKIERDLGKTVKPKNHPRKIDLDILFFAQEKYNTPELEIPHPRWKERLFVLIPLSDLVKQLDVPMAESIVRHDLNVLLKNFINFNNEKVMLLP
jgi:2-amino-4-hydroxy-6-hydroxymethyldihydropteridine diphosphokinase